MAGRLQGKRILITQADDFMGPTFADAFREEGAEVLEDRTDLTVPAAAAEVVAAAGEIDVLVANLAAPSDAAYAVKVSDERWNHLFDVMVHPMHRLVRAALPAMMERRSGKIIVVGSATGLKAAPGTAPYSAARSAQVGYVRSVGVEAARFNVQINLIAQHFVENPEYFSEQFQQTDAFKKLMAEVPAGRLARPEEDAALAIFLASSESDFFVGQAIPFSGGWAQ
ncbi:MAG: SDR family oxidoreductase [Halieaceae bacterium]|nr:SDR family oxidoreductase [Halieaceae bacterium]